MNPMQRGRFAQEFLAELMREPRALRIALLSERARWLRGLKVAGREELLFELELLLRALELGFSRRQQTAEGRALLGQDFSEELRASRDALHRAGMIARRLTAASVEQSIHFRAFLERQGADETRRSRVASELVEQKNPEEALYALRHHLRAMQGVSDQLLRLPYVTYQVFSDFAVLGEHVLLSSKYFRPPGALEFRTEYDRVGSVRLLELVKRVGESRARKALALGFLSCFRLLRYLRYIPALPVPAPRRSLLIIQLVRDEAAGVANYLATDVPRLVAQAAEAQLIVAAAGEASDRLRDAIALVNGPLNEKPIERSKLDQAREVLSEAAKTAASALAKAVEPGTNAAELFDGQRARRERAERLRRDLWILGQLLRNSLDGLFPAMRGEPTRAFDSVAALVRFTADFRQMGYYLLRAGDHEPFDRFFGSVEALTNAAPSPARDRHLYLDCRRFLTVVDRALALVSRRAELLGVEPDLEAFQKELQRVQAAGTALAPALDKVLADQLLTPPMDEELPEPELPEMDDAMASEALAGEPEAPVDPLPEESAPELTPVPPEPPPLEAVESVPTDESPSEKAVSDAGFAEEAELDVPLIASERRTPPPRFAETIPGDSPTEPPDQATQPSFPPELTRRIWRGD